MLFGLERIALLVAAAVLSLFAAVDAHAGGDVILRGGAIYTLDVKRPWASAVVIRDGQIVYVGDDAGAQAFAGSGARVVALDGRMVLPGFHDSHIHPMTGGMRLLRCRLNELKSEHDVYEAVRICASKQPKGAWLLGSGWSPQMFGAHAPSRAKLDELAPDRPAYLTTEDGYSAWVNSRALALAGLDRNETTGVVEGEALNLVRRHIPTPTEAEYREALRRSTAMANRFGITSLVDASATPAVLDAYRAADVAGELRVRVVAAQRIEADRGVEQIDEMVARRDRLRGRRFRADSAKIFLDGDIDRRTAAMLEPYVASPASRGDLLIAPEALNAIVRRLDGDGFLIHMHAMGDRAVRVGLDAIEFGSRANGIRDRRHQLTHIGVADPADIRRFGSLKVAANFQPAWANADDPASAPTEAALGPERWRRACPIASIATAGGRLVASSDWPSPSMNPLDAIQIAMTRQPLEGGKPPLQPQQRIGLSAILAAYTIDGAWIAREEALNGSIEIGKAADLIVLDRNLFKVDVMELHKVRVLLTLLDGAPVYRNPDFSWPD